MILEQCQVPFWAKSGHAQTILGHLLPSPRLGTKGKQFRIPTEDGDQLVAFVQEGGSDTVVYIFHGLAGSTDSTYMHRTSLIAQQLGHTVVLVNHRGCGEGRGMAKGPYHSGRAEDLSAAIEVGRKIYPRRRHLAIGFSMSGNALLLLLSGQRGQTLPDAAISVNAPIHLSLCSELLGQGLNRIYDLKFYIQCRKDLIAGKGDQRLGIKVPRFSTLFALDHIYTAPAGGFNSREDYYATCSTYEHLDKIKVPTIVFTAKDDPFVPVESYAAAKLSPNVHLHIEEYGGHMGYLSKDKTPLGTRRWQDYAIHQALRWI